MKIKDEYRVGLDVDGPCADYEKHFLEYLNLPKHLAEDWDDSRFVDNYPLIENDLHFWNTIPPTINGKLIFMPVAAYCTARPVTAMLTREWLKNNGFPDATVFSVGHNGNKVKTLKAASVNLFLDDRPLNFEQLNDAGIDCLLVTRSHNKQYRAGKRRIDNLLEFQEKYYKDGVYRTDLLNSLFVR